MDDSVRLERRIRYVPQAIERTEKKLFRLYQEAADLRMYDLLDLGSVDRLWERTIVRAKMDAIKDGHLATLGGKDAD